MKNNVKLRRLKSGLTVRKLAEISGVPASTISEIENEKREPGVAAAIMLARALRCNVDGLFVV
ncbi:helix-turn-helix transcriptional regulator [Oscillibacter sp.]|uniref:helix-turn-helix transcriptional regulator n=1 Tax=Oscillibacter sp. TaxID=1945593 RepID=UPI0028A0C545|nr:helix-turn-helix transcriptional regulator [Oscillibacter sp.]